MFTKRGQTFMKSFSHQQFHEIFSSSTWTRKNISWNHAMAISWRFCLLLWLVLYADKFTTYFCMNIVTSKVCTKIIRSQKKSFSTTKNMNKTAVELYYLQASDATMWSNLFQKSQKLPFYLHNNSKYSNLITYFINKLWKRCK